MLSGHSEKYPRQGPKGFCPKRCCIDMMGTTGNDKQGTCYMLAIVLTPILLRVEVKKFKEIMYQPDIFLKIMRDSTH